MAPSNTPRLMAELMVSAYGLEIARHRAQASAEALQSEGLIERACYWRLVHGHCPEVVREHAARLTARP